MYTTEKQVNQILNYSKYLVKSLPTFNSYSNELKELMVIIVAGMLSYYGTSYEKDIYNTISKTKFIYLKEEAQDVPGVPNKDRNKVSVPALFNEDVSYFENKFKIQRYIKIIDTTKVDNAKKLTFITHELNHALHTIENPICKRNNKLYSRIGLSLSGLFENINEGRILEETINTLETQDIIKEIINFSKFKIEDKELKNIIKKYTNSYNRHNDKSYITTVPIIKPLYDDKKFNQILKEYRMTGDLIEIREEFDKVVGPDSFNTLSSNLDSIGVIANYTDLPTIVDSKVKVYTYTRNR